MERRSIHPDVGPHGGNAIPALKVTDWPRAVNSAVTGLERRPDWTPGTDQEADLLGRAAAISAMTRAGFDASSDSTPWPSYESGPQREWNSSAPMARLVTYQPPVIIHVLTQAAAAGLVSPKDQIVPLLEQGVRFPQAILRERICQIVGPRGRWLASLNPEWKYAVNLELDLEDIWNHGAAPSRLLALERIALTDRDRAFSLALDDFESETPTVAGRILEILSPWSGREEFLFSLLGSRSEQLRRVALTEIARLPGNEVTRQAEEIGFPLVHVHSKSIEIDLPPILKPATRNPTHPLERFSQIYATVAPGVGWRQNLLQRIVTLIPPSRWLEYLQADPSRIVKMASKESIGEAFLQGIFDSGLLHQDPGFALAVSDPAIWDKYKIWPILNLIPKEQAELVLLQFARGKYTNWLDRALDLDGWSESFSVAVLDELLRKPNLLYSIDSDFPLKLHPSIYPQALALAPETTSQRTIFWVDLISVLHQFNQAFQQANPS